MSASTNPHQTESVVLPRSLKAEEVVLLIGLGCFILFLGLLAILFASLPARPRVDFANLAVVVTSTPRPTEFTLPPTWTPTVTPEIIPTMTSTPVFTGRLAVHLHQPRPPTPVKQYGWPTLLKLSFPNPMWSTANHTNDVIDLARIIQGESAGDKEAAYRVGWVAKNRLRTKGYGRNYYEVSSGFFGYRPNSQPSKEFIEIAKRIIRAPIDPTHGSLYALSRTDITNLGVPASRADVAYGEWFFFKTWFLHPK